MPKQIGINFPDNDFYYTVMSFMNLLIPDDYTHHMLQKPCHHGPQAPTAPDFTKGQIVELFNKLADGLYLMKQNGWRYDTSLVSNYITIAEKNVFFDEEVAAFIKKGNLNGEFFCVDFAARFVWSA